MGWRWGIEWSVKAAQIENEKRQRTERGNWAALSTALVVIVVLCGLFYFIYNRQANSDYEGRIVDGWADYAESQEGSRPIFQLRVESDDGKRFNVKVDPNVYQSARVGMRIRSKSGQIVLIESEEKTRR